MPTVPHSIRVPEQLDREISGEIERRRADGWTTGALELLEEAVRASRAPGIVFVAGRRGRRAAVAFSGLEVWEIIATWQEGGEEWETLREAYSELADSQLRAALNYYALYPEEIDERLEREAYWTPERTAEELPFTQPVASDRSDAA